MGERLCSVRKLFFDRYCIWSGWSNVAMGGISRLNIYAYHHIDVKGELGLTCSFYQGILLALYVRCDFKRGGFGSHLHFTMMLTLHFSVGRCPTRDKTMEYKCAEELNWFPSCGPGLWLWTQKCFFLYAYSFAAPPSRSLAWIVVMRPHHLSFDIVGVCGWR